MPFGWLAAPAGACRHGVGVEGARGLGASGTRRAANGIDSAMQLSKLLPCLSLLPLACGEYGDDRGPASGAIQESGESAESVEAGDSSEASSTGGDGGLLDESGDSNGEESGADGACAEEKIEVSPEPPAVLFVLDKSGSMAGDPWEDLHAAVSAMMTDYQDRARFGLILTPWGDSLLGCDPSTPVTVPCAIDNEASILSAMPAASESVAGNEAVQDALTTGFSYMNGITEPGDEAIVLVGDGGPTCETDFDETAALVAAYASQGIHTYVIGVGSPGGLLGGRDDDNLNQLADAGGKAVGTGPVRFYDAAQTSNFTPIMDDIIGDTFSCKIPIPTEPMDPFALFKIEVDGSLYGAVDDCASEDGFIWSVEFSEVTLCGEACERLNEVGEASARYYCSIG